MKLANYLTSVLHVLPCFFISCHTKEYFIPPKSVQYDKFHLTEIVPVHFENDSSSEHHPIPANEFVGVKFNPFHVFDVYSSQPNELLAPTTDSTMFLQKLCYILFRPIRYEIALTSQRNFFNSISLAPTFLQDKQFIGENILLKNVGAFFTYCH